MITASAMPRSRHKTRRRQNRRVRIAANRAQRTPSPYIADCARARARWNKNIEEAGIVFACNSHRGFRRAIGEFKGTHARPKVLSSPRPNGATHEAEWLPTQTGSRVIASLMTAVTEPESLRAGSRPPAWNQPSANRNGIRKESLPPEALSPDPASAAARASRPFLGIHPHAADSVPRCRHAGWAQMPRADAHRWHHVPAG